MIFLVSFIGLVEYPFGGSPIESMYLPTTHTIASVYDEGENVVLKSINYDYNYFEGGGIILKEKIVYYYNAFNQEKHLIRGEYQSLESISPTYESFIIDNNGNISNGGVTYSITIKGFNLNKDPYIDINKIPIFGSQGLSASIPTSQDLSVGQLWIDIDTGGTLKVFTT